MRLAPSVDRTGIASLVPDTLSPLFAQLAGSFATARGRWWWRTAQLQGRVIPLELVPAALMDTPGRYLPVGMFPPLSPSVEALKSDKQITIQRRFELHMRDVVFKSPACLPGIFAGLVVRAW
jgi:hypothetical protein